MPSVPYRAALDCLRKVCGRDYLTDYAVGCATGEIHACCYLLREMVIPEEERVAVLEELEELKPGLTCTREAVKIVRETIKALQVQLGTLGAS